MAGEAQQLVKEDGNPETKPKIITFRDSGIGVMT